MPRGARKPSSTGVYHIMVRGINHQVIFEDDADRDKYLNVLCECCQRDGLILLAYCLMPNHIHLLVRQNEVTIGETMKRIGSRYVGWYNMKYGRIGPLFQDRFKSEPVEDETYLLRVVRYIHVNPVKAGLCDSPEKYTYSSYRDYFDNRMIDSGFISHLIGRDSFMDYHSEEDNVSCLEIGRGEQRVITDAAARQIIRSCGGGETAAEFQTLSQQERDTVLRKILKNGVSIRQASRLTGISVGIVRKQS